ncbi:MAG: TRAP transporter small permease [Desulfobacterales bacterium]|jgi:TRAP-type C4-dicarboxylate transport system permease small subunit|nr:TRAP transporter small permease [Desulfobacterales bacterium]
MTTLIRWLNRLCDGLRRVAMALLVVSGAVMSVVVMLQIIFRFVIYIPLPWSEELARYLMIWTGMVGSFVALREGRHIGVTLVVNRLPPRTAAGVAVFVQVLTILFLLILAKQGLALALINLDQLSPAMRIPMFFPYLAVPVGAALMIIELAAGVLQDIYPAEPGARRKISAATLDG